MIDETNAREYVATAMRHRLDDIATLLNLSESEPDDLSLEEVDLNGLGFSPDVEPDGIRESADVLIAELPLCVDQTHEFHIVLGTGGPDDRIIVECDVTPPQSRPSETVAITGTRYEVRRILYRYSWDGSGEVVLHGEDYQAALDFAHWHVPELGGI
jgi:hypothetical protein